LATPPVAKASDLPASGLPAPGHDAGRRQDRRSRGRREPPADPGGGDLTQTDALSRV